MRAFLRQYRASLKTDPFYTLLLTALMPIAVADMIDRNGLRGAWKEWKRTGDGCW